MLEAGKVDYRAVKATMIEMAYAGSRGENRIVNDGEMACASAALAASMDNEGDEKPGEGHLVLSRILMHFCQSSLSPDKEKYVPYVLEKFDIGKLERLQCPDVAFNVGLIFDYLSRNAQKKSREGRGLYDGLAFQYYKLANKLWSNSSPHKKGIQKSLAAVEERLRLTERPKRNSSPPQLVYRDKFECL